MCSLGNRGRGVPDMTSWSKQRFGGFQLVLAVYLLKAKYTRAASKVLRISTPRVPSMLSIHSIPRIVPMHQSSHHGRASKLLMVVERKAAAVSSIGSWRPEGTKTRAFPHMCRTGVLTGKGRGVNAEVKNVD